MRRRRLGGILAVALAAALPGAARPNSVADFRKAPPGAFALAVERRVLPNGLVVLLAPDPTVSSVAVWTTFRAGAQHAPRGKSGLAHLVEHVLASGPTPDTDYAAILERRGARWFNATTGLEAMSFEAVVPAEELPAALWAAADRLVAIPPLVDAALVERHRRVVLQERAVRQVDAPYGLVTEALFHRLYADPHPLHGGVIGAPADLAGIGAEDVRALAAELLVPANAVLVVAGRFDPAAALRLVEDGLGRLPAGRRAPAPPLPPVLPQPVQLAKEERLSREPRVTLAWRLPWVPPEDVQALRLGAQLLEFLTDGAWGMRIGADLVEYESESLFVVELVVPYDEPASVVHRDADGFVRFLTHREIPVELVIAANLALDRAAMFGLDDVADRARVLADVERAAGAKATLADLVRRRWDLDRYVVRDTARTYLKAPSVVLHARPTRPKAARLERE